MKRKLTRQDVEPAMIGGLLLSAGGSGVARSLERHDLAAEVALGYGDISLVSVDALDPDGYVLISTSVGAPGFAKPELVLRDHVDAARSLIERLGKKPDGVICGHVPGFNGWLVAAALDIPYIDAAANGRGHPTVQMGGMGLASKSDAFLYQVAQAGYTETGSKISVIAQGNLVKTSQVMRHAAIISGGLVASARGPYETSFVAANAALGAISFQVDLGKAMLEAAPGSARIRAAADFMKGDVLVTGTVLENSVVYRNGFDVGRLVISDGAREIVLGIYNEFMTADRDGQRVATFPDMIGSLDPVTGDPIAIAQLPEGAEVSIVVANRSGFPLGKGALDPSVFAEVEEALGVDLFSYLETNSEVSE
ncbi:MULTISPECIES: DUF917 family protein [unclassified Rhizobium]|uniref:S-methyl thiohydantoin desulfurase domain-containing protein n=1 Tax=unclassified Rhizobium TaxID=2613769 RepID=UPI000BD7926F|nr:MULTISPECIES: DUF917 family protein [unclassified Rhizobium]MDH7809617.1 DUF917 family protein [Rhizobium sp. AN67]MDQ4408622.1 DUF917 family protein [Rhizobium sp. AN63]SOD50184.1 hypothetical protein SAMN05216595_0006 [Rhizobium sp. AN6A]SOD50634.1 hypothetical protein SAMN05216595_0270 [Rhizobium sp. AN6A]